MRRIRIIKERTREKTKGKAKTEEEEDLKASILTAKGTSIAHRNRCTRITNLHSHHKMMDYVGIVTNPGILKELALNW